MLSCCACVARLLSGVSPEQGLVSGTCQKAFAERRARLAFGFDAGQPHTSGFKACFGRTKGLRERTRRTSAGSAPSLRP